MDDYYSILGCDKDATIQQIRKQYKKLALQLHPDKNQSVNGENTSEEFNLLNKAFSTLTDEMEKHKYDTSLLVKQNSNKIVNDEVTFEEFTFDEDNQYYVFECRCGGQFVLSSEYRNQLITNYNDQFVIVDCNCCSLSILVTR